jgi:hypothetical protein
MADYRKAPGKLPIPFTSILAMVNRNRSMAWMMSEMKLKGLY